MDRPPKKPRNPWSAAFLGWKSRPCPADSHRALYTNRRIKPAISDREIQRLRDDIARGR